MNKHWRYIVLIIIMVFGGIYIRYFTFTEINIPKAPLKNFPHSIKNWKFLNDVHLSNGILNVLKVDDYLFRTFHNGTTTVNLYIGYYQSHRRFGEIHTPEHCQVGGGWEVIEQKTRYLDIPGKNLKVKFIEAVYKKELEEKVFVFWYQLGNKYITDFFSYKIHVILNSLFKHRSDAAFVRITTPVYNDDIESAINRAEDFIVKAVPVINNTLP